jgi:predicted AlkP superfamily pyrophosphatase or phosphodiesterase
MIAKATVRNIVLGLCLLFALPTLARKTTILISCDGFRWDYPQYYDTPFLDRMAAEGVSGELVPSFPSKTFPNHYTLVTGLRPEHHGIIANSFIDRTTGARFSLGDPKTKFDARYYHGEPLWLTAQRQGLKAVVFYWPGSDVAVNGKYPNVWHKYNEKPHMTFAQRADSVMAYLTKKNAPDLILAYFEEPDGSGHSYGPQAKETRHAVESMDSLLNSLWTRIVKAKKADDVNFVVVSDHGMTWFTPSRNIDPKLYLHKEWYTALEGNLPCNIYAPEKWQQDSIIKALSSVPHLHAWRKADIPQYLHYQADANIGDVLVLPDEGYLFDGGKTHNGGVHGYDPGYSDMHALFRAWGPDLKHVDLGQFSNTAVYPFVCHLLGIQPAKNDGESDYEKIEGAAFK